MLHSSQCSAQLLHVLSLAPIPAPCSGQQGSWLNCISIVQDAAQEAGRAAAVSAALEAGRVAGANESIPVDLSTVKNRTAAAAEGDASQPLDPNWGTGISKGMAGAALGAADSADARSTNAGVSCVTVNAQQVISSVPIVKCLLAASAMTRKVDSGRSRGHILCARNCLCAVHVCRCRAILQALHHVVLALAVAAAGCDVHWC